MPKTDDKPLAAKVCAVSGKYTFLNVGSNDGVQVKDVFDDYEEVRIIDPDTGEELGWAHSVMAELYVEFVMPTYCYCVLTYAQRIPYFEKGMIVERGHSHRITSTASFLPGNGS